MQLYILNDASDVSVQFNIYEIIPKIKGENKIKCEHEVNSQSFCQTNTYQK